MTFSWTDFHAAEPAFADTVRQRFEKYTHHVLATLRKDGSPRVTGLEVGFCFGELWLGMMPHSRKAQDLRRDARCAIQANPGADTTMADGDVRVSGRAVEVTDPEVLDTYAQEAGAPQPFHLFRLELTEVVRTGVEGDELVIRTWRPGHALRTIRRGNDESAPRTETP
ncbi:pyridoxamine 5'-phosphate oxidase family protein [Streptomyces sp. NPDC000410]|uniref:pyridoxamine 5'-phosphate oxidase family protein n=1 Tax=Streptomyces sp. NPDC000410 TaxID=3154254 RepID=UPI00332D65C4